MDAETAQENHRSGQGMDVRLQFPQPEKAQTPGGERNQGQHGSDCNQAKRGRDQDDTKNIVLSGRVHHERDERLAGSKNEYSKENPGGEGRLRPRPVKVIVIGLVDMRMLVLFAFRMSMNVRMGFVFERPPEPPDKVSEPEADKKPGGQAPSCRLNAFQAGDGYPQSDADEA